MKTQIFLLMMTTTIISAVSCGNGNQQNGQ